MRLTSVSATSWASFVASLGSDMQRGEFSPTIRTLSESEWTNWICACGRRYRQLRSSPTRLTTSEPTLTILPRPAAVPVFFLTRIFW